MDWRKLFVRIAWGLAGFLSAIVLVGAVSQAVLARRDARRFPPPGRMVDVGGRRLHLQCSGTGSPTLLFEMGAGAWGLYWTEIQRDMAKVTRTCTYDRAGFGWSDPGPLPRSPDALVSDLRALVEESGEEGPFVLVGHSMGGWLIRAYQARYPEDVVGMALVESAHPRQWEELPPEIWESTRSASGPMRVMAGLGHIGLLRLMVDRVATQELPAAVMPAYRATAVRPSAMAAFASEIMNSPALAAEAEAAGDLGDLPLVVVSAGKSFDAFRAVAPDWPFGEADRTWMRLQTDLLTLSARSWQHVSPGSTHDIHADDPAIVVTALQEVVDTVRTGAARGPSG